MEQKNAINQQNQLIFESLKGEEKMNFFVGVFIGNLVSAMKLERKQRNLTQQDLAKRMNVKQAYVSKIEQLDKIPTIETIGKYLFALDYSLEEASDVCVFLLENDNSISPYSFSEVIGNCRKEQAFSGGFVPAQTATAYSGRF